MGWFSRLRGAQVDAVPAPEAPRVPVGPRKRARLAYEGAKRNRLNSDWNTTGSGANTEIGAGLPTLRNRSSDLARNNPHAISALEGLTANIISSGIRARWADDRVQALWDAWCVDADVSSDLGFAGLQTLMVRSWLERGDVVIRRRWRRIEDGLAVPFQIELLEGDFIDHQQNGPTRIGGRIVQGVEFDPIGRRLAYWLHKSHPGESGVWAMPSGSVAPIDAADIAHLYRATRPGQVRGVPWLSAVIELLRNLERYEAAERNRKRSQAGIVGVVTPRDDVVYDEDSTDAVGAVVTDSDGNPVDEIEPNSWYVARNGSGIQFSQPVSDAGFTDYLRTQLRTAASGAVMPYEVLTRDLSQVNYSSIRLGLVEFQRLIKALQTQIVIPLALQKVARWFLEAGIASGKIAPGTPLPKWVLPEREEIDRETAIKSAILAIRAGLASRADHVAANGGDAGEVLKEIIDDLTALDAAGITLDTDPRHGSDGPAGPFPAKEPAP